MKGRTGRERDEYWERGSSSAVHVSCSSQRFGGYVHSSQHYFQGIYSQLHQRSLLRPTCSVRVCRHFYLYIFFSLLGELPIYHAAEVLGEFTKGLYCPQQGPWFGAYLFITWQEKKPHGPRYNPGITPQQTLHPLGDSWCSASGEVEPHLTVYSLALWCSPVICPDHVTGVEMRLWKVAILKGHNNPKMAWWSPTCWELTDANVLI